MPQQWKESITVLIYKSGVRANYWGILLLPTTHQTLSNIFQSRQNPCVDKIIVDHQYEFWHSRSTIHHGSAFIKRVYMTKKWEYKRAVHRLFTDFKKVYDSITRDILYNIFNECDILINLVRLNRMCLNVTYNEIQSRKYLSVTFTVQKGLKEGHVL
jgi:hypothetical protein